MENFKSTLLKEISNFRELGHKFVNGDISSNEFKATSGGMGAYAQLGGEKFMVRMRIPSGILDINMLKVLHQLAKKQNLDKVHLTTRQAIQLHDLSIDGVCDTMEEALKFDIYTRGGGGNFPRNVSLSPLTGVDVEEAFDVTEYAIEVNKHFMSKITTYKLPRKLKVSFSSSDRDLGNCTVADLGFLAVKHDGREYFKVYIGGGLGKNPAKAVEYDELVETKDVLYHVEAITNLFINEGNYENKNKARIRYIVDRMGREGFIECYKKHLKYAKETMNLDIEVEYKSYNKKGSITDTVHSRLINQKQEGLYSVYFHPINGQLSLEHYELLLNKLEKIEDVEVRLSMDEGMYIRNLNGEEATEILELTQNLGGETSLQQSVACIGVPTCQIGIGNSQETLNEILTYFEEKQYKNNTLPKIRISGCSNSCGTHQLGVLGLAGKKKRIDGEVIDIFDLFVGGKKGKGKTELAIAVGSIKKSELPAFLYELSIAIDNSDLGYEEFILNRNEEFDNIVAKYLV